MNIGIIGAGRIGSILATGLAASSDVEQLCVGKRGDDHTALAQTSDVIILCVKPFQVNVVLEEIGPHLTDHHTLVSVAAAVSLKMLRAQAGDECALIRAMPNTPCRIGAGMTALAACVSTSEAEIERIKNLFSSIGRVCVVPEGQMDAVTGLSGCGPAYGYLIVEALTDAGVKLGIQRTTAQLLAAQTMLGAAQMILQTDKHPAALRDEVTTPAGCTIDGLMALEQGGLRTTLSNAVIAAAARSAALCVKPRNCCNLIFVLIAS
ncbi:MAG: pyrroline-5-carboxylate reductase [Candidatus Eremiobacteraeota bacterium]|nr:pyrroline-5-carboxylate reductase [Candidatus Eremiobacteraeota bacterium]